MSGNHDAKSLGQAEIPQTKVESLAPDQADDELSAHQLLQLKLDYGVSISLVPQLLNLTRV
jgi:hypothetical protein